MVHWFDLFVGFFLFASALWSYFRGFAREVFSFSSLIAGYLAASSFYGVTAGYLESVISDKALREISAFALLFFVAVILTIVIGSAVRRMLSASKTLSAVDRIAGVAVGVLKGALFLSIIAYPFSFLQGTKEELMEKSVTAPYIVAGSTALLEKFAPGLAKSMDNAGITGKKQMKTIERIRDSIKKLESGAKDKARAIKEKVKSVLDSDDEKSENGISKKDKKEMNDLLESVDLN
ncbi:hypothetical protein MNBD_NITROSPINAE01-877 [hydrothermal vent metagenome]|uniref:Colicin V production protein n=1 Tax=hydrothermal vent metagenome TaxID=652676 RepID=A0A3B1D0M6_9ZZZZ